jgi:uncharacterized membrane protein (UPF0182 family)
MRRLPLPLWIVAGVLLLVVIAPQAVQFYVTWLWFGEVGYQDVYRTFISAEATLFVITFAIAFIWFSINLSIATRATRDIRPVFTMRNGIAVTLPGAAQLQRLAQAIALLVAVVIGLYGGSQWDTWLTWRQGTTFAEADPILGYNVAFYVFSLPFYRFVIGIAETLVILAALASGVLYFLTGHVTGGAARRYSMSLPARRHLFLLVAMFLLLMAASSWLGRLDYLVQRSTHITGASYTDVHARIPVAALLAGVCVVGAALAALQGLTFRNWPVPVAIVLYVLTSVGGEAYASMVQRFAVNPNEQARETPFIQHNIDATRRAFGIDTVEERQLSGDAELTRSDIERNGATLNNVRLWDRQPLLDTFGQIQVFRTYYDFVNIDNDRYVVDGVLRQVMLSARELNLDAVPNRTWISEHLTYTHGYGLTLGPVNQVTNEGLPVLFIRNVPPESTAPELKVVEPSIYFGEQSNDYVIVRTRHPEFHYPRSEDTTGASSAPASAYVETRYAGKGGLSIGSFWRKLVFAAYLGDYQILLSDDITDESRVIFNRQIAERVRLIAPFLAFDEDPYLVLADGRLYWICDAYTTTAGYPYSTRRSGVNYIRNSVKFVVDAYHGTTTAYLADDKDPIAQTYASIFPSLFRPLAEMPATLREHVRYPEDIFRIQAETFATYHMTQPSVYFNREDQWDIPAIDQDAAGRNGLRKPVAMQPYYTIMKLPGESAPEFIEMLPYSPYQREPLAAWLAARSDGKHYGKLEVFQFPKQKTIFGPRQVIARISQDQMIAPQITLWNQQGSKVDWGTLMVIPVEESLLYVQPLYLRANNGKIPELTRVAVAYQERIVMERTLDDALERLFEAKPPPSGTSTRATPIEPGPAPPSAAQTAALPQLAAEARTHYDRAVEAQRAGDWAKYGEELRMLGELLGKMR